MTENPEAIITQDERTMATLAHALQVVGWWIAPLIIFLTRRKSAFVSFHALQAVLLQIIYMVLMAGFMAVWFLTVFLTIVQHQGDKTPPVAVFVLVPLVWFGFTGMWAVLVVIAIIYAIKAGRGEWANYPLIGKIARRILKLEQGEGTATATGTG